MVDKNLIKYKFVYLVGRIVDQPFPLVLGKKLIVNFFFVFCFYDK